MKWKEENAFGGIFYCKTLQTLYSAQCYTENNWITKLTAGKTNPSADKQNAPNNDIKSSIFGIATANKTNEYKIRLQNKEW